MFDMPIFWGDMHDNIGQIDNCPVTFEQCMAFARSHLDFYAPAYYTAQHFNTPVKDGRLHAGRPISLETETWKTSEKLAREWREVERLTRKFNDPGRFVTFPGYEWHGDGVSGDHNVFFPDEGRGEIHTVMTLPELYDKLRGQDVIAIPHHTGYSIGARGKDWSVHDDTLSPFAEVYSLHGSSEVDDEWIGLRNNHMLGPGVGGGTYQDALDRGYHVGAICSPDGNGTFPARYNLGVMACIAPQLTREALWEAFRARRVYGVTGDRIQLDFRVNGAYMGEQITAKGKPRIEVAVRGLDALDRVEVLRDGQVIHTYCHQGAWQPAPSGKRSRFVCRIEAGWGMYPNAIGPHEPRQWNGKLTLAAGGTIIRALPCWYCGGQTMPDISGSKAEFAIIAPQADRPRFSAARNHNAFIFEVEADPDDQVNLEMDHLKLSMSVAELARASHVMIDNDTGNRQLREVYGFDPTTSERPRSSDIYAPKVKVHRWVPEAGLTCAFDLEDDTPLDGEHHYRVRVEQRNGQRAWSSPVWVAPA